MPLAIEDIHDDKGNEDQPQQGELIGRSPELTFHPATLDRFLSTIRLCTSDAFPQGRQTTVLQTRLMSARTIAADPLLDCECLSACLATLVLGKRPSRQQLRSRGDGRHRVDSCRTNTVSVWGLAERKKAMPWLTRLFSHSLETATRYFGKTEPEHLVTCLLYTS